MPTADRRIGLTTTVPVEVVLAAGLQPVDLNNIFITDADPRRFVQEAEKDGFPANTCAWIKGIYSACLRAGISRVVGVVHGDCSNTFALLEILRAKGVRTVDFAFPLERAPEAVRRSIQRFCEKLGTNLAAAEEWRRRLCPVRSKLAELEDLAASGLVTAREAHSWLVSSTDFRSDPEEYQTGLGEFLSAARRRPAPPPALPVALAGVPPIAFDFFEVVEELGARIVYNEVPTEFSMSLSRDMCLQDIYYKYSYPYDTCHRLSVLRNHIARRAPLGLIHYQQSFCHRQISGMLLKEALPLPVLQLECDRPGPLDAGARTRLESFLEMLRA
jgi:benzoyl-CoA reductase/2-hydroxyglutaryl-CoA dehydratase subunit BcrC/BadD/HgdB